MKNNENTHRNIIKYFSMVYYEKTFKTTTTKILKECAFFIKNLIMRSFETTHENIPVENARLIDNVNLNN